MDDRTKLVESLGKKIDRVLDDNRRLRSEALGLTTERDRLLRQKREAENRIRLLEKRIKTLVIVVIVILHVLRRASTVNHVFIIVGVSGMGGKTYQQSAGYWR